MVGLKARSHDALARALGSIRIRASRADSIAELTATTPAPHGCLVVPVSRAESGFAVWESIREAKIRTPTIALGDTGDVQAAVRVLKEGAVDFFAAPLRHPQIAERVRGVLDAERRLARLHREAEELRRRFGELSPRESDVLGLVVNGVLNKQIAARLGISPKTVEMHRSRLMSKLGVRSLAELGHVWCAAHCEFAAGGKPETVGACLAGLDACRHEREDGRKG